MDLVEDLHGRAVPDPYRWLEDGNSAETVAWASGQDQLWAECLAHLDGRDRLRARLEELAVGVVGAPIMRGNRYFFSRRRPGEDFAKLIVVESDGAERVLIDPAALSGEHTVTLDSWLPSPDGNRLAYTLSEGGNEESSLYVMDVVTTHVIEGPIDRVSWGSVAWLPGGDTYYYVRRPPPEALPPGEERLHRRVYRHQVGTDPSEDDLVFGEGRPKTTFYNLGVSVDGRWLTVLASTGGGRNDVFLADLFDEGRFEQVQEGLDALTFGGVKEDGLLYLWTTLRAPRRRVVVTDPTKPGPEHWRELIPQGDDVITAVGFTDDAIVVVRQRDVVSEVALHDRSTGEFRSAIPLPGLGSVARVVTRREGGHEVWIGYTDFLTPYEIWHHDTSTGTTKLWARPPGGEPAEGLTTTQVFYHSTDGTRVPLFLLHRQDVVLDGSNPTILYGYGGFNNAQTPAYAAARTAWVEQGGVYAIANIRGGSEYGEEWHRAGMRENKQNVFADFMAAGDWLVDNHWTSREHLGISGASNGGLLVGAAMTQRPDLCRAVLCSAPVLDAVRRQRFQIGVVNVKEYGDADIPEELDWLLSYSPYHHVQQGIRYPAVLFTQGEADARVDPMHTRKMCAALQWASTSGLPILLRRQGDVGHGRRSMTRTLDQAADTLSWLAQQLGLRIR